MGRLEASQIEALGLLVKKFPAGNFGNWNKSDALSPRAQAILRCTFASVEDQKKCARLLSLMASYDLEQGRHDEGYRKLSESLKIRGDVGGLEEPAGIQRKSTRHTMSTKQTSISDPSRI